MGFALSVYPFSEQRLFVSPLAGELEGTRDLYMPESFSEVNQKLLSGREGASKQIVRHPMACHETPPAGV